MKKLIVISAALVAFAVTAQAQDIQAPTLTMDAPLNGVEVTTKRVTVTGMASDDTGVTRVQYRIEGSRRWRNATLTFPDSTSTAYVFSFTLRKNKRSRSRGRTSRVYIRAIDAAKNESDTTGRKVRLA